MRIPTSRAVVAAAVLLALALATAAHPPQVAAANKIGLVMPLCCDFGEETKNLLSRSLQAAGISSSDIEILVQRPGTDRISLLNSIRKLVAYEVKLLVVFGSTAAREAAQETRSVPVVFIGAYDPVKSGVVADMERPGKNVTGVTCKTSLTFLLDNILETQPLQNLGVIYHTDNLDSMAQLAELQDLASKKGLRVAAADAKSLKGADLAAALRPAQFLYLAAGCYPDFLGEADLEGLGKPIATQCQNTGGLEAVFTLAASYEESFTEAATLASRLLRGEKAAGMAVGTVRKIDFVINLQAAQRLGIKVPFGVLSKATRVVK